MSPGNLRQFRQFPAYCLPSLIFLSPPPSLTSLRLSLSIVVDSAGETAGTAGDPSWNRITPPRGVGIGHLPETPPAKPRRATGKTAGPLPLETAGGHMPRRAGHAPKKQPGVAIDKRNGQRVEIRRSKLRRFDPPSGLSEQSRDAWETYWNDPVSELATPADRSLLIRWIGLVDRYQFMIDKAMEEPEVRGSTGQKQVNGFFNAAAQVEGRIAAVEAQLGIGPKNRAALGIAVLSEQRSLTDLNREFEDADGTGELDGDEDDDPRVSAG